VTPDLSFVLHGNPLSQNAIYRRGRGKRLYMSDEGRSYIANVGSLRRWRFRTFVVRGVKRAVSP
jgi:hypothetical protein